MMDKKRIDLQKHVSPKVPRRYLIRIGIYTALVVGLLVLIYFMQQNETNKTTASEGETVEEIRDFTIDTTQ